MSSEPPRRRHSPAVYRRRRIVLIVGLLAVIALVWLLIAQPWRAAVTGSTPAPTTSRTSAPVSELPVPGSTTPAADGTGADAAADAPEATPTAQQTPTATPCVAKDVTVEPITDSETYGSGQNPQLSIQLTNNGDEDCSINVGTSSQVFTIKSGDDVWWRSTDCQTEPSDMVVLLAAGQSVSSAAPLAWDRTRSSVDSCGSTDRQVAPGGGASYNLSVEIGGIRSTQAAQLLLY
ncbi:hypothetical protein [Microbacterium pygmaeum]|uniref:DUF4232 domain-containing protein n=1 Tax=Microbacterium pygmaeum TaxID=370764 RepID=A0A1G7U059_9MICO|nr:hypothetical protein [Microbacterium pygmaeum]SDG40926.1 hypothetical protein SAMN04489810_0217 [Microbacterium pygmaeum]